MSNKNFSVLMSVHVKEKAKSLEESIDSIYKE